MARDNFSEATKKLLCEQVGGKCSKPDCRVMTFGPNHTGSKRTSIGEAAHITAAAKGGERFDSTISKENRKSEANGIWLCRTHAREIDANPDKFPVTLLKEWKARAISLADSEIGKRQLSQDEADSKAVDTLMRHTQPDFRKNDITSIIQTVHQGVVAKYENLDPRFNILTQYDGKNVTYNISAKENTPLTLNFLNHSAKDFSKQFSQLKEHGKEVNVSTDDIEIKGSLLFEHMIQPGGTFTVMPVARPAVLKLSTRTLNQDTVFDDVIGNLVQGSLSSTFEGKACDGLLTVTVQLNHNVPHFNIKYNIDCQKWFGIALLQLPFFNKVIGFFRGFSQGALLKLNIEIQGESVFQTENPLDNALARTSDTVAVLLNYIDAARTICRHTQSKILFDIEKIVYENDDYNFVLDQATLLNSSETYLAKDIKNPITCSFLVEESRENLNLLTNKEESCIRIEQSDIKVKLLDVWILLPTKRTTCTGVTLVVTPKNYTELKFGDKFNVTWKPTADFTCLVEYIDDDASQSSGI
jgi:hypothetical protein